MLELCKLGTTQAALAEERKLTLSLLSLISLGHPLGLNIPF